MKNELPAPQRPAVTRGPRVERRRVLIGGSTFWGTTRGKPLTHESADAVVPSRACRNLTPEHSRRVAPGFDERVPQRLKDNPRRARERR